MFRHALRLALVVTLDVILMYLFVKQFTHYTHGYWLAMTSIIVLQPYTGETVRKSAQRVLGTVAGAVLAAVLASAIHAEWALPIVIAVGATLSVALYAVDYAWYCFFLTPTIVLLTLPHLRDWHFAAVRMGMTGLGALIAVAAMLLLWPERESLQLPGLLARAAAANAGYLRAVLTFWRSAAGRTQRARIESERTMLAPARRLCGLAANDAEETLDHALLEHAIPLNPALVRTERINRASLTFTTYLRRLTQTIPHSPRWLKFLPPILPHWMWLSPPLSTTMPSALKPSPPHSSNTPRFPSQHINRCRYPTSSLSASIARSASSSARQMTLPESLSP
jgi:uncharacterized membrane protein YccC